MTAPDKTRPTRAKKKRRSSPRPPNRWQRSAAWKRIASQALKDFHAKKHLLPRCGAHARTSGEPCKQIALENGRCHWHGGKSPSGPEQNRRQLRAKKPSRQTKSDWPKAAAKVERWNREDKDRKRRLVLMTQDEFVHYFRRTHARQDQAFRKIVDSEMTRRGLSRSNIMGTAMTAPMATARPPAPNPELEAIEAQIAALQARLAELAPESSTTQTTSPALPPIEEQETGDDPVQFRKGVFA